MDEGADEGAEAMKKLSADLWGPGPARKGEPLESIIGAAWLVVVFFSLMIILRLAGGWW